MGPQKIRKVVVDTNVLVSGLLIGGVPSKIVNLWKSSKIQPIASAEIIDEYLKVLSYPKFHLDEEDISFLLYHEILPFFDIVKVRTRSVIIVKDDPSNDKFIYCAISAKAKTIISGDQHLLDLKSYKGTKVVTPSEFLRQLQRIIFLSKPSN